METFNPDLDSWPAVFACVASVAMNGGLVDDEAVADAVRADPDWVAEPDCADPDCVEPDCADPDWVDAAADLAAVANWLEPLPAACRLPRTAEGLAAAPADCALVRAPVSATRCLEVAAPPAVMARAAVAVRAITTKRVQIRRGLGGNMRSFLNSRKWCHFRHAGGVMLQRLAEAVPSVLPV
jgi:hypothetical protein